MSLVATLLLLVTFTDVVVEAEDAVGTGVVVDSTRSGYAGRGYVTGFDAPGDSLRFGFEAEAGIYELFLTVAHEGRAGSYTVRAGGATHTGSIVGANIFRERLVTEFWHPGGADTVVVRFDGDVDALRLAGVDYPPPTPPATPLSDAEATEATEALYAFLKAQYGRSILSGQQELREARYIEGATGLRPAVVGGDLIEYSPTRWERGARPGGNSQYASVEEILAWAEDDAIVAMMWHWNAPADLIDTPNNPWWRGFYSDATTFDLAAALADTASYRYSLILRDIDAIAAQLQKFADADVPVLWRPLHEAAGEWFWWGNAGSEAYVELWRLLYDRLVHHHELHNLIWVYTHEPNAFDWYPGDDYVDIVGRDAYPNDPAAVLQGDWQQLQDAYGDRKLIALSESGVLPNPEVVTGYGVWWSWFSMWSDNFIRNVDRERLNAVYHSDLVLTRDELPDWRAGSTVDAEAPAALAVGPLQLYPNPTVGAVTLRFELPAAAEVRVAIYDALGRRVYADALGARPAGAVEVPVALRAAPGVYVARVEAGGHVAQRTFVVAR